MANQLIGPFAIAAFIVALYYVVEAWTRRIAHLNLGLFHPYRKDPWPVGVQEDDDARFQWTPPAEPITALVDIVEHDEPSTATIEDILGGTTGSAARVDHVSTHAGDAFHLRAD